MIPRRAMIPRAVRGDVLARAAGRCEECDQRLPLELHHLTYSRWPQRPDRDEPIFGHETSDALQALCRDCHHGRHIGPAGDFIADPEECESEWDYWQHMTSKHD
jgi:5-methylcytosine-specific restriction endonuclease McrA